MMVNRPNKTDGENLVFNFNVYDWSNREIFTFIDNIDIKNSLDKYRPEIRAKIFTNYLDGYRLIAITKQRDMLISAIIENCIDYMGLHKYVDYDVVGRYRLLLIHMFSNKKYQQFAQYQLVINNRINQSIANNLLIKQTPEFIINLVLFTQYRCNHIRIINEIIFTFGTDKNVINKYIEIANNMPYDYPYPFIDEEINDE